MSNSDKRWVNLSLYALDEAAEIAVFDGPSQIVARGLGRLETQLEPGIYKVRAAAGSETWERLVKLEAGRQGRHIEIPLLPFATPVPLPDTAQASDSHQRAALEQSRRVHVNAGQGSAIFIFVRRPRRRLSAPASFPIRRDGLTLHSLQGDLIADLALASAVSPADDALPWAACNVSVNPGIYRLRQQLPDGR